MAVMASEAPIIDPVDFVSEKAQPAAQLPDTDADTASSLAAKPVNGDAPHSDAPVEDPSSSKATQNGIINGMAETPAQDEAITKTVSAEDESAAPVEHVEGGISGVAAFLPNPSNDSGAIPPATEPPATMTEPASVEQTTSDVRDEPLPADPAEAIVDAEGPENGEASKPSPTPADAPGEPGAAPALPPSTLPTSPTPDDKMDTAEDGVADMTTGGTGDSEMLLDKAEVPFDSVEAEATPDLSSAVTTIPAPAEDAKPADTTPTGQVRPREEDDETEAEPAAKRAKTESRDDDVPMAASDAPQAKSDPASAPSDSAPASAPATEASAPDASTLPVPAPAALPQKQKSPPLDSNPITTVQEKFLLEQIRKAKKTKSAVPYLNPVDYVALNIPTYPQVIQHPMDLKTMEEKLKAHEYPTADAMMEDFEQMVHNSQLFNGAQHPVAQAGQSLRAYFIKCVSVMPKGDAAKAPEQKPKKVEAAPSKPARPARQITAPPPPPPPTAKSPTESKGSTGFLNEHGMPIIRRDSSAQNDRPKREIVPPKRDLPAPSSRPKKKKAQLELKFCETVIAELHKKKYASFSYAFLYPVDPVALNIPNYLRVIKKPMDFGTIQQNLKNGHYQSAKECFADCKLVFANCYKFNPETDEVYKMGKMLEEVFDQEWAKKDAWIQQNMPPSEPATEDEEEEEEEEEPEEDPNMRRMQEIQAQIAALSAEAMQLTSQPRRASPKAPAKSKTKTTLKQKAPKAPTLAAPKPAKPKKAPKPKRLTMDQKREVSEGIANLDEAKMRKAVQIIRNGVPHLANVQDDELELDIDEIPEEIVYKLWEFVKSAVPKREREPSPDYMDEDDDDYTQRGAATGGAGGGRRKNKPMKAQEQEERIKQLQAKLQGTASGGSASPVAQAGYAESEGDSESSEEE